MPATHASPAPPAPCPQTTLIATDIKPARVVSEIESTLKVQLVVSTLIMTPVSLSRKTGRR